MPFPLRINAVYAAHEQCWWRNPCCSLHHHWALLKVTPMLQLGSVTMGGTGDVPPPKCCPNFALLVESYSVLSPIVGNREKHGLAAACAWFQGRLIVLIRLFNSIWREAAWMFLMFLPWSKCMPESWFLCYQLHQACIFQFQLPHFLLSLFSTWYDSATEFQACQLKAFSFLSELLALLTSMRT